MYFSTYEAVKVALRVQRNEHAPLSTAAAGAAATIVNDALMTPGDVIKQRLQIANSPYRGVWDCIVKTYQHEGIRAFYRSYKTTVRTCCNLTRSVWFDLQTCKGCLPARECIMAIPSVHTETCQMGCILTMHANRAKLALWASTCAH